MEVAQKGEQKLAIRLAVPRGNWCARHLRPALARGTDNDDLLLEENRYADRAMNS